MSSSSRSRPPHRDPSAPVEAVLPRGLRACVLAGGLGTRLRSVVGDLPKALAPIGGRPFLDLILRQLAANGIRRVTICTGYGRDRVRAFAGDGSAWGLDVSYSEEATPLGTAGAIRQAWAGFRDDQIVVFNGDTFFDVPLGELAAHHRASGAAATLAVRETDAAGRFGEVVVGDDGDVVRFREKSTTGRAIMNGGVYVLDRGVLDHIAPGQAASLERDVFPTMTAEDSASRGCNRRLSAAVFNGFFIDIGVPADYDRLNEDPRPVLRALADAATC